MFLTDYVKKQETGGNPVDAIDAVDSILNLINTIRALGQSGYTPLTPISLFKLKKEPEFEAFKRYHLTFLNEHFTDEQVFQFLATVPQKKYFQKELYGQIVQFAMHDIAFVSSLPSIPEHLQQFIKNTLVQERVSVLCGNSNASTYERMRDLFRTISQQSVFHPSQNQRLHKCIRRLTFQN
jgi:hypothetical protein